MRIDFHFDYSCPYAYLGSTQIEELAARVGAELRWRPMLLGGVFRAVKTPQNMGARMSPPKARHNLWDMQRWADLWSVPLRMPPGHPLRTVRALRATLACPEASWPAVIAGFYRAYWVTGEDIADRDAVARVLERSGVSGADRERALAANDEPAIKDELRRRTDEAIELGIFGAPTTIVRHDDGTEHFFWGQDRLHMVEACCRGWRPDGGEAAGDRAPAPPVRPPVDEPAVIDFWYDFSSPFAYLGSTQIERVAREAGATLRWRPMLLGAVFKQIGTPNVPLQAMSDAKRRYSGRDLHAWAAYRGVPFRFTSRFPMKTVTALRLALLAGDRIAELSHALYRALWVEDRDLSDDAVLRDILTDLGGFDADDLLARTRDPEVKEQLVQSTAEAVESGVFGAPTCIVRRGEDARLFWGQDRVELAGRAAAGWEAPGLLSAET